MFDAFGRATACYESAAVLGKTRPPRAPVFSGVFTLVAAFRFAFREFHHAVAFHMKATAVGGTT